MAAPVGTRFLVGLTGAAAVIAGGALWNSDYGAAELARGRDPGFSAEKVFHYVGDIPFLVETTFIERPLTPAELETYQVPLNRTPEELFVFFAGVGTVIYAYSRMK